MWWLRSKIQRDTDITVQSGVATDLTSANWNVYQAVTLAAAYDADYNERSAVIRVSATRVATRSVTANEQDNQPSAGFVTNVDYGDSAGGRDRHSSR